MVAQLLRLDREYTDFRASEKHNSLILRDKSFVCEINTKRMNTDSFHDNYIRSKLVDKILTCSREKVAT